MRHTSLARSCLALVGLASIAALVAPGRAGGYTFLGGQLDLAQRDVRVFNNFSDPEANDNLVPDPNFPGALGAPLAIWKAICEWGSERRGDGQGDPHQPGGLGSGGANFDAVWQGLASAVGGPDDNVVSEIGGSSLGVLAYTELPISDGWRIRFYADAAVWIDGPQEWAWQLGWKDIQGVMTHEYGHALGLGHSSVGDSTMFPSGGGTTIPFRSLALDDQLGVQALYGPRSPAKPGVGGYELPGAGALVVTGRGFAAQGNEVWFTDGSALADGTPLKVTGLVSSARGTRIALTIPAGAAPGDLLVKLPGTGGDALSNAFPFDPAAEPCPLPRIYGTAKLTSLGTLPTLELHGRPRLSTGDLLLATAGGIPGARGLLFSGARPVDAPFFGGSLLCARPLRREQPFRFDFLGGVSLAIPVSAQMVGTTRCYQLWFQDAGDPHGVGLSDAVQLTFCP